MTYLKALREDAPLLDAYLRYFEVARTPFTIPGHKQRASKLDLGLGAVVDGDSSWKCAWTSTCNPFIQN